MTALVEESNAKSIMKRLLMADTESRAPGGFDTALVFAGGGVAGIAWELGVLRGIADADADLGARLLAANLIVGTSAGASVAAEITSGVSLDELYAAQLSAEHSEIEIDVDKDKLFASLGEAIAGASDPADGRRRLGAFALAAQTVELPIRLAAIEARLPAKQWPDRPMKITAVDVETGDLIVFTAESGVALVDAVAASAAVPGVWPPVPLGGHVCMDGGARSMTNADLASGAARVLVIQPSLEGTPQPWGSLDDEIVALTPGTAYVISADQASMDAFGVNPLSPSTRPESARAGRAVGAAHAAALATFWN